MNNEITYLEKIVGSEILEISMEVSSTYAMNEPGRDPLILTTLRLVFYEYTLFIYNKWEIVGCGSVSIESLKGQKIADIKNASQILEIWLENSCYIGVNMADDGYLGPEALCLYGPDNLIVVWN